MPPLNKIPCKGAKRRIKRKEKKGKGESRLDDSDLPWVPCAGLQAGLCANSLKHCHDSTQRMHSPATIELVERQERCRLEVDNRDLQTEWRASHLPSTTATSGEGNVVARAAATMSDSESEIHTPLDLCSLVEECDEQARRLDDEVMNMFVDDKHMDMPPLIGPVEKERKYDAPSSVFDYSGSHAKPAPISSGNSEVKLLAPLAVYDFTNLVPLDSQARPSSDAISGMLGLTDEEWEILGSDVVTPVRNGRWFGDEFYETAEPYDVDSPNSRENVKYTGNRYCRSIANPDKFLLIVDFTPVPDPPLMADTVSGVPFDFIPPLPTQIETPLPVWRDESVPVDGNHFFNEDEVLDAKDTIDRIVAENSNANDKLCLEYAHAQLSHNSHEREIDCTAPFRPGVWKIVSSKIASIGSWVKGRVQEQFAPDVEVLSCAADAPVHLKTEYRTIYFNGGLVHNQSLFYRFVRGMPFVTEEKVFSANKHDTQFLSDEEIAKPAEVNTLFLGRRNKGWKIKSGDNTPVEVSYLQGCGFLHSERVEIFPYLYHTLFQHEDSARRQVLAGDGKVFDSLLSYIRAEATTLCIGDDKLHKQWILQPDIYFATLNAVANTLVLRDMKARACLPKASVAPVFHKRVRFRTNAGPYSRSR